MKNGIKYFVGCGVPVYVCNFKCLYCYLGQHPRQKRTPILPFSESPEYIAHYFLPDRIGGLCYFNFCGSGETMLHPQLIPLIGLLTKEGHFADIITNGTLVKKIDELIKTLDDEQKKHVLVKFSFHYLELKRTRLMDVFIRNVRKIKESGISYSIEITPHDSLIPYIEEIKTFSLNTFGALPQITVARNEATSQINLLTEMSREKFKKIWSSFDSPLFDFKLSIFNQKRCEFCYAGLWSFQLVLETGDYYQCYGGDLLGNINNPNKKLRLRAIGRCREPHCFNGHAYLTFGTIPTLKTPSYNEMRDRVTFDKQHWIQPEARAFFETKLSSSNEELSKAQQDRITTLDGVNRKCGVIKRKFFHLRSRLFRKKRN